MPRKRSRKFTGFKRADRVGAQIQRVLSAMLVGELADPRLGAVTLTDVEMSKDNRYATVYFSLFDESETVEAALAGLESAAGRLRSRVGAELALQHTPELRFKHDPTLQTGRRISDLLGDVLPEGAGEKGGESSAPDADGADDADAGD
ncbi:30S ribosome-binding factor RbfA [bacterium]|nr:30S ribosome-binding factor RbfA [bacterium]